LKAVKQNCATCKEEDSKLVDHDLDEWSGLWCIISLFFFEECYLNNQFSGNLFDNYNLQRKSSTDTETIAIER